MRTRIEPSRRNRRAPWAVVALGLALAVTGAVSAEELPPPPVHTPEEQLALFRLAEPGYRIELVAAEPMVQDPVVITFDGEGRLWVAEMRGYMPDIDGKGSREPTGRVSVLEDIDGDGKMDRSTVFADGLVLPRAVAVHPDGVLIAEHRALTLHRDLDGDLVSDEHEVIDPDYAKDNIEHSANGLCRGMDNRLHNAKEGHLYRRADGRWVREATEARGQWGICQDDLGRLFYNFNHSPLHVDLAPPGSLTRNPHHDPATGLAVGVVPVNRVFPIRPTPAANRGYIPGVFDEEGRIKQYTSACAPLIYRDVVLPGCAGDAFVCEPVGNLVQRIDVASGGSSVAGSLVYPDRDFLASSDERFRPCWLAAGPDGGLYIADMYRGIVQDAPHMSPYLKEHSMARQMATPVHKGRVWRVVPAAFEPRPGAAFSSMSPAALVEVLAHESGWWRDRAQMELVEGGGGDEAIPALLEVARSHENRLARLHALWTLEGLRFGRPRDLRFALRDEDPAVQAAAIRVLHSLAFPDRELASGLEDLTEAGLADQVALQVLVTAGDLEIPDPRRFSLVRSVLLPRIADPLMRDAALSGLGGREGSFLVAIGSGGEDPGFSVLVEALARAAILSGGEQAENVLALLDRAPESLAAPVLMGFRIGAGERGEFPVLHAKPGAVGAYPELADWFAWPGHVPDSAKKGEARPLTKKERALFARGRQVYVNSCVACHGSDGKGTKLVAPPLAGSDWVTGNEERLARVLFHGLTGPITVSGKEYAFPEVQPLMPPLASLDNGDTAAVLTYIRREWGNTADPVSSGRVSRLRIEAQGRTVPWTEEELEPFASGSPDSP